REQPGGLERPAYGVELGGREEGSRGRGERRSHGRIVTRPISIASGVPSGGLGVPACETAARRSVQRHDLAPARDLRLEAEDLDLRLHDDLRVWVAVDEEHRPREARV